MVGKDLGKDLIEVDQKVGLSRNRVDALTDKRAPRVHRPNELRPATKNGPAKRSRHRKMEREMRFELTTSTLAIFA